MEDFDEQKRYEEFAARLREAHRRVRALPGDEAAKEALGRRLIAIANLAKRDVPRAARRLERLLTDVETRERLSRGVSGSEN
ncbi:hypothetical protein C3Y87_10330 [Carbonactinospora thermoautotrophica]|uniref:Uncharacterized protein n=1 Tax=Carbonactinospora thermoautotrophica TaxID=1469144 RepID=A0A132NHM7_9ACTN|nr:hypothetical protein [Carbonactinospora thermoautotrophica]KWW99628.1 hypothetical protein LI90_1267 [Carbonactinospora thermoautotrophica]KWX03996.1 hypothetical protein TH66_08545 [Carbonactinospora thermoautotrophica]KWX09558.1 hypothetical protein TR74_08870 [Carbonactinospora thermoautotrophica]MCX9191806.1 hypothetical protein [Carbonactinospora thermoautotrophica]